MASMWASLSDTIIFETIQGPGKMTYEPNGANWVQQDLLEGKPRMQKVGINLQKIDMTIRFHAFILPFASICAAIEQSYLNGDVLSWVYGNGEALGNFVILNMKYTEVQHGPDGLIIARDLDISLAEYAGPGVATQTSNNAVQTAFANQAPTDTFVPNQPETTTDQYSGGVSGVNNGNTQIGGYVKSMQGVQNSIDRCIRDTNAAIASMQQANAQARAALAQATNVPNGGALIASLVSVQTQTEALASTLAGIPRHSADPANVATIAAAFALLNAKVIQMMVVAQPMQSTVTWWPVNPFIH